MAKSGKVAEADVGALLAAVGQLVRRLRTEARSGELNWTQLAILARLDAGRMTTADLARAESMKPQSMGAALAQMEEEGLVARQPHPTDGRQILYALTPAGAKGRLKSRLAKRDWLLAAVAKLDAEERRVLFSTIDLFKRLASS